MARQLNRLSPVAIKKAKPGMWPDGGGLYLQIRPGVAGTTRRSWVFRYAVNGKDRQMGLGSAEHTTLAEARGKAEECRRLRNAGLDPIDEKENAARKAEIAAAKGMSFDQCRDAFIASHRAGWRNAKHGKQWLSTLKTYVTPVFGSLPVHTVDTGLVTKVLEPIWAAKPETATRVRGRIESVLDWAKVRGYRDGENPARWRGHLDHLLPKRSKVRAVEHHAALPYQAISEFIRSLRTRDGIAARALEFAILTAARTGEVLGARWDEMDLENEVWTIPASRMKSHREHRVPLSEPALAILKAVKGDDGSRVYVFPGEKRPTLSNMALLMLLRRMGRGDLTAHGFRSAFRDWAGNETSFQREVAEAALAHVIGDNAEQAYRRSDALAKRRKLMDTWAAYCERGTRNVVVELPKRTLG
jgi:integrase